ncbi:hypothetical protein BDV28DRAFT_131299 [Aspergillus coremiiformis]|uniref:Uncharacterized protein n=1 Tax=Aspergillus coremiiformis TaxID=138285 RepID=A0A5N6Z9I5_9EURO|nr:hypothetical protein BDV28DRAFT_131299 [Aspergillus coremiiformis]
MVLSASAVLKASRGVTSKSNAQSSGTGNRKDRKVDRATTVTLASSKPQNNLRVVSTSPASMEARPNCAPPPTASQPQESRDEAALTTFPPFSVGPKDKARRFLGLQGPGESDHAAHPTGLISPKSEGLESVDRPRSTAEGKPSKSDWSKILSPSRFNARSSEELSVSDDTGMLTPITEVPSEPSSPVNGISKVASDLKPPPITEAPPPTPKSPPTEKPPPRRSAPEEPKTPVDIVKNPQIPSRPSTSKRRQQPPSKLSITTSSSTIADESPRRSERTPENNPPAPRVNPPQRLSSPFHPAPEKKAQAWEMETIASEDSWFQDDPDSDESASEESGPRRTPPGQVRARLTVETVECTFQPPIQTPDLEQTQRDSSQGRSEFFPPWAVGSEALSQGTRGLRK